MDLFIERKYSNVVQSIAFKVRLARLVCHLYHLTSLFLLYSGFFTCNKTKQNKDNSAYVVVRILWDN